MRDDSRRDVTTLLGAVRAGDDEAAARLVALVYDELHGVAAGLMKRERAGHTLQPTALLNEALVRLLGSDLAAAAHDRRVFYGAAARAMRQVLVDHARRRGAAKRIEGRAREPLDETIAHVEAHQLDVLALHEALDELAGLHARQAKIVELRSFGGFTVAEVAELLDVSVSLVESDYRKATAFLRLRLGDGDTPPAPRS